MTRTRLAQMVLADTVLQLAAAALIASAVTGVFMTVVARVAFPGLPSFRSDEPMRLVLFIIAAALVIGIAAGIAAALHTASRDAVEGLSDGASAGSRRWLTIRHVGIAVQGGAAIVLVVCATLFLSSLRAASHAPLGYDADRLVWITSQPRHGASRADLREELARLRVALSADSSVERVALADRAPRMAYVRTNVYVDSGELPTAAELGYHRVGREYFDVMGMRVREGRAFGDTPSAANEVVVSEEMAKQLAPQASALGICLRLSSATAPCRTVVGVVDEIRDMRLDRRTSGGYYVLSSVNEEWQSGLMVRARGAGRVHLVQQAAARLSTNSFTVESYAVSTLIAEGRRTWQAGAVVLSLFAGVAFLLSVVGLSASIAEDASRRTHEFALRSAIGADPFQLATLVAREGAVAVARMVAIGGPAATLVVVYVRPLLFGATAALTPALVASAIVVMITLFSLSLPALHLRHVDAASVLRATT